MIRGEAVGDSNTDPAGPAMQAGVATVRGPVRVIEADTVNINQGGASEVRAAQVDMHLSGAGSVDGEVVHLDEAAAVVVRGTSVLLMESTAGIVVAGDAAIDGSRALLISGGTVHATEVSTGVLLAREVHGDVNAILDTRGALLAGLVGGLAAGGMIFLASLLAGRKRI